MACELRKTRIVCISDTHNQTPKLPKGDVLIHAGDMTNQGSYSELKRSVEWLEKTDFEAVIVIAGNHDVTLDADFYAQQGSSWRWPTPQDPKQCRKLLADSPSILYLDNEAATVRLHSETGPHTCFKVFGSPCTPKTGNWAFQYTSDAALELWDAIPRDTDIVITHTPPKNHCDTARDDERSGCRLLLQALHRVRPMLSVFGHIHGARGVERVRWNVDAPDGCLEEDVEVWKDPGVGNKQSLVNLTAKGGRPLDNVCALTRQSLLSGRDIGGDIVQPGELNSTSRLKGVASSEAQDEAAIARCQGHLTLLSRPDVETVERRNTRRETVMVNSAFMGPRSGPRTFNKPIVVDVDLPVWTCTAASCSICTRPLSTMRMISLVPQARVCSECRRLD